MTRQARTNTQIPSTPPHNDDGSTLELLGGLVLLLLVLPLIPFIAVFKLITDADQPASQWKSWEVDFSDGLRGPDEVQKAMIALNVSEEESKETVRPGRGPIWQFVALIIPSATRVRVFGPAYEDLKRELLMDRAACTNGWRIHWLVICFNFRSFVLVVESLRVCLWAQIARLIRAVFRPVLALFAPASDDDFPSRD